MTTHQDVLAAWRGYHAEYGDWPTVREIANRLGIHRTSLYYHLRQLTSQGQILEAKTRYHHRRYQAAPVTNPTQRKDC